MSSNDNPYQYHEEEHNPFSEQQRKPNSIYSYVNPSLITSVILFFLIATIIIDSIGVIFGFGETAVLKNIQSGTYESVETMQADAEANDFRVAAIGLVQTFAAITLGIVFLFWTYRVCKNANFLNMAPMTTTPGWAVGWYFIPIFNLWKPYLALSESFRASCHPDGEQSNGTAIIGIWWFFHIFTGIFAQITFRMALNEIGNEPEISRLLVLNGLQITGDFIGILLNILTLVIVLRFSRCQQEAYKKSINSFV